MLSAEGPLFRVSADSHATKSFRRPYGRHFFTFGESHVTRLTLPCNNRYSVAPLLTIPLGGTNCLSFRQAFLLLPAEGPLFRVSADSHATKSFRRPYGRHFFTFGESHVTRLTLPCNNRYSVAPLLTIPLGGTNCLSFRQAFLLLPAEGSLFRVSADSHATTQPAFMSEYSEYFGSESGGSLR